MLLLLLLLLPACLLPACLPREPGWQCPAHRVIHLLHHCGMPRPPHRISHNLRLLGYPATGCCWLLAGWLAG